MIRQDEEQYESTFDYNTQTANEIESVRFLRALVKVQAWVRGFLTRKMIYQHLQNIFEKNYDTNEAGTNSVDYEEATEEDLDEFDQKDEEEVARNYADDYVVQNYSFQEPVYEVNTEDEMTSEEGYFSGKESQSERQDDSVGQRNNNNTNLSNFLGQS